MSSRISCSGLKRDYEKSVFDSSVSEKSARYADEANNLDPDVHMSDAHDHYCGNTAEKCQEFLKEQENQGHFGMAIWHGYEALKNSGRLDRWKSYETYIKSLNPKELKGFRKELEALNFKTGLIAYKLFNPSAPNLTYKERIFSTTIKMGYEALSQNDQLAKWESYENYLERFSPEELEKFQGDLERSVNKIGLIATKLMFAISNHHNLDLFSDSSTQMSYAGLSLFGGTSAPPQQPASSSGFGGFALISQMMDGLSANRAPQQPE